MAKVKVPQKQVPTAAKRPSILRNNMTVHSALVHEFEEIGQMNRRGWQTVAALLLENLRGPSLTEEGEEST